MNTLNRRKLTNIFHFFIITLLIQSYNKKLWEDLTNLLKINVHLEIRSCSIGTFLRTGNWRESQLSARIYVGFTYVCWAGVQFLYTDLLVNILE